MFFFYLRLNKWLSKQWWSWWFETPSRPLYDVTLASVDARQHAPSACWIFLSARRPPTLFCGLWYNNTYAATDHYSDVMLSAMTSQITGIWTVYSVVCPVAHQRKHQSSASLAIIRGIHRWPVESAHKGPVTMVIQKMFSFDDVIMIDSASISECLVISIYTFRNGDQWNDSPYKGPVTRKMFSFDDVMINSSSRWKYLVISIHTIRNIS